MIWYNTVHVQQRKRAQQNFFTFATEQRILQRGDPSKCPKSKKCVYCTLPPSTACNCNYHHSTSIIIISLLLLHSNFNDQHFIVLVTHKVVVNMHKGFFSSIREMRGPGMFSDNRGERSGATLSNEPQAVWLATLVLKKTYIYQNA